MSQRQRRALDFSLLTCFAPYLQPSLGANSMCCTLASVAPDATPNKPRRRAILMRMFISWIKNMDLSRMRRSKKRWHGSSSRQKPGGGMKTFFASGDVSSSLRQHTRCHNHNDIENIKLRSNDTTTLLYTTIVPSTKVISNSYSA